MDGIEHVMAVIHLLAATYGHTFGKEQTQAYVATLRDIDGALLKAAALRFIERNVYPRIATPGELRQFAAEIVTQARGLPAATEAWGEVMHQLRYVGSWGAPSWTTPLVARAVADVGGWPALCMTENITADRARFIAAYDERLRRHTQDMMQLPASEQYRVRLADKLSEQPDTMRRISDVARAMSLPAGRRAS